jgi:hypothetical protein
MVLMLIYDPLMGRRQRRDSPDYYAIALVIAVAFILCLLVGCAVPLR